MSRFGGLSEERPSVFKTRSKLLVLIYRPNAAGMKGRVDLAQPVNRTPDLWCGSPIHYHSIVFVDEQIEELLRLDLKEESDAEKAYPIVCVNKKDGTLGLSVDFRVLNSESLSNDFPMEDAVELIHSIGRANIIKTLDLLKGYLAIPIAKDSKNVTFFKTPRQQYRFKLNFTVNLKKCAFGKTQIKYLGHIICSDKHEPDPEKTAVINNLPVPKTKKELRSVLGLCNY
ncbi:retrovirus-related Pol polyprotein from transposon 17.6 [Trichonephila clavipes]|uniref:Retrovirus-related Pol polyprotein from transposon 17.6 n=1 Tax=Trichonephila clavipes TaxID=2585209 RepID=A0A8X6R5P3_TRICX|nr:retrovirus-related Pol polyprotein from transposon 17.6 [Trichonephila clavipes]